MRMTNVAWVLAVATVAVGGCKSATEKEAAAKAADKFDLAKDPAVTAETHFAAAHFAETQGNTAKAIEQYAAAVKLKPDYQPALYRLGILYTRAKMWPQAIDSWKRYIKATGDA